MRPRPPDVRTPGGNPASAEDKTDNRDSAIDTAERKRFATLQAQFALRGYCLRRIASGDGTARFCVARWNLTLELHDLAAVEAFADRVGVAS